MPLEFTDCYVGLRVVGAGFTNSDDDAYDISRNGICATITAMYGVGDYEYVSRSVDVKWDDLFSNRKSFAGYFPRRFELAVSVNLSLPLLTRAAGASTPAWNPL